MEHEPKVDRKTYWKRQIRRIAILLSVWFVVAYVLGIFLIEPLNSVDIAGVMPLGFWIAQQGSIYIFVGLILIYALLADRADREAGLQEE